MKNLLYTFLAILVVFFVACEEDDIKPFEGTWAGTYTGGDSETWEATVTYSSNDGVGVVTGTTTSSNAIWGGNSQIAGALGSDGTITAAIGTTNDGGEWVGKFEKNDASGTWKGKDQNGASIEGTWTGKKK